MMSYNRRAHRRRWGLRALAVAGLALPLAACDLDSILEAEDVDVVTPGPLADSAAIDLRVGGVLADLQVAYSGAELTGGLVPYTGLFSDELYSSDTFETRGEIDRRNINPNSNAESGTPYQFLQRARLQAVETQELVEKFEGRTSANWGIAANIEGYTEVLLAEAYCSGIPFSREVAGSFEFGDPLTTKQTLERALASFDEVLAANTSARQTNLARVGKARTLLNLGRFAEAAAAAAAVPDNFVFAVEHSNNTPGQRNSIWALQGNGRLSVSNTEGTGTGTVAFRSLEGANDTTTQDPRIPYFRDGEGFDDVSPLFVQEIYDSEDSDVPLASGLEARLIQAEALLNLGASAGYLPIVNTLRAGVGLDALTDPGTPAARVDQFFRERAFFLYLTAHRLGDMRRLVRQYGRPQDQVFPSGAWHKERRSYGSQTAIPIPVEERNNPKFQGCLATEGF